MHLRAFTIMSACMHLLELGLTPVLNQVKCMFGFCCI